VDSAPLLVAELISWVNTMHRQPTSTLAGRSVKHVWDILF
jgi:hypothetical protein